MPRGRHIAAELRDECLNQEIFFSLKEAQIVIEQWRNQYNTIRPHSSIGYRPLGTTSFVKIAASIDGACSWHLLGKRSTGGAGARIRS
jgi:hypothetical protein